MMKKIRHDITEQKTCRISGEPMVSLFTLGKLHVSDFLPKQEKPYFDKVELKLCLAPRSGLVQLAHTTPQDVMYRKYWYKSGTNATMTRELEEIAALTQKIVRWKKGDVFVD